MLPRSPLLDFAESHYVFGLDSAISGAFKIENSPYLAEPFAAWCNAEIREITLMFAAQMGKNVMAEICASYIPIYQPGNILVYSQTDDDASDFGEERVLKRAKNIPHLQAVWPNSSAAWRCDEALLEHMFIKFLGANKSNARGKSAPYEFNDELHIWDAGMLKIVRKRVAAYWYHKILNTSTAGEEGSEIDLAFKSGTMEDWHLGCPECGKLVKLRWSEKPRVLVWTADDITYPQRKKWNIKEVKKTVRFVCPHEGCNAEFKDSTPVRKEMNLHGGYVVGNPDASPDNRSFHASQMAAHWVPWESIVEQWIEAVEAQKSGDITGLKTFVIEVLAETWMNRIGGTQALATGDYALKDKFEWDKEVGRLMAVDVQAKGGRHMWYVVRAFAQNGESRLVACGREDTWPGIERRRIENVVLAARVNCDTRYAGREVLEVCSMHGYKWLEADERAKQYTHQLANGAQIQRPYAQISTRDALLGLKGQGSRLAHGMRFSKYWARQILHNHLVGQGKYWGLPSDINDLVWTGTNKASTTYIEQLQSWVPCSKIDKNTNARVEGWKKIYEDDHFRACEEMLLVRAAECGYVRNEVSEDPLDG